MPKALLEESAQQRRPPRRQARGTRRRDAIVAAAAELILEQGPVAVTHRSVAAKAGVPLAATTYYFTGLDDLIGAAGERISAGWADHALAAAARVAAGPKVSSAHRAASILVDAILPDGGSGRTRGFYEHLVSAGRYPVLIGAYTGGRDRLDTAIGELLTSLGVAADPSLLIAIVDGAAVSGLAENHDVRGLAISLVEKFVRQSAVSPS